MVLSLLAAVNFLRAGEDSTIKRFDELIMKCGANNGYGDFVRAAKIIYQPGWSEEKKPLPKEQLNQAWQYVFDGVRKPVSFPDKPITWITLFPELAVFKHLHKEFVKEAEGLLPTNEARQATDGAIKMLQFATLIPSDCEVMHLVGVACMNIQLRLMIEHHDAFTLEQLTTVSKMLSEYLQQKNRSVNVVRQEWKQLWSSFIEYCEVGPINLGYSKEQVPNLDEISAEMRRLTPAERESIYNLVLARFESRFRNCEAWLSMPESTWSKVREALVYAPPYDKNTRLNSLRFQGAMIFAKTVDALMPFGTDTKNPEVLIMHQHGTIRTKFRIALLGVELAKFKKKYGRLPDTLQAAGLSTKIDPFTRTPYIYKKVASSQGFTITCSFNGKLIEWPNIKK